MSPEADTLEAAILGALDCSPAVATSLAAHAAERTFAAQTVILRDGDAWIHTHLVIAGRAGALVYGLDGRMVMVHEYGSGDVFGPIGSVGGYPANADIVALDLTRTACFPDGQFVILVERHGALGLWLVRRLMAQLRTTSGRMVERVTLSAPGRVYAELLRLARLGDGSAIRPPPVLAALAVRVQSTRETVSRAVSHLERRGIVRRDGDALIIVAPGRLAEMVV